MSEQSVDELIQQGIEQQQTGNHDGSVVTFSEIVLLDPEHAQAWYCKAIGHGNLGQNDEAIAAYRKSVKFAGDQAALPLFNLGNLYQDLGDDGEAALCFQQATEIDPTMVDAWINLGRIRDDRHEHSAAIECYDVALRINEDESMAWSNRGNSLRSLNRIDEAIETYRKALALDDEDFAAQVGLGACLAETGEFEAGMKLIDKVIELSGHPLARFEKATMLAMADRNEEAAAAYDDVLQVGFRSPEIWNNRGECLAKIDRIDDALDSFDQSIAGNIEYGLAYFGKARVLVNAGRIAEAKTVFEQLIATADQDLIDSPGVQALKKIVEAG